MAAAATLRFQEYFMVVSYVGANNFNNLACVAMLPAVVT